MTAHSLAWAPLIPWFLIAALALGAVLLLGFGLLRRARGLWARAVCLAALILALANPAIIQEEREALNDVVMVVSDETESQAVEPRPGQTETALSAVLSQLEDLPNSEHRLVRVSGREGLPNDRGTRLFEALERSLASVPRERVGAVIMLSDGQVHDVPESFEKLGIEAPLHLLQSGLPGERDRRLIVETAPSFGLVGKPVTLSVRVEDLGSDVGRKLARMVISKDGTVEGEIGMPIGETQEITVELDHRGPNIIELKVDSVPGELTESNNHNAVVINGVRERLRVLLVSGEPYPGERAWRNILKSDPSVDLVHFTILRPPEKQDGTPINELSLIAFPTRELFSLKLHEFDLIIFDRYQRRGVLPSIYLDNIAAYVEQGGALLEAVGPSFATPLSLYRTPLGRVMPGEPSGAIVEQGFRPDLTEIGLRHPVTRPLAKMLDSEGVAPWGRWFRQIEASTRNGKVLMNGVAERPLLILARVEKGRVAQIMSDHLWLWSRGFEGGGPQSQLVRRLAHWLMREPELEEEDLTASVEFGRVEIERRSLSEELPELTVTLPSGRVETLALEPAEDGLARASLPVTDRGLYRISDGTRTAMAATGELESLEFADLRATAARLEPLVSASGGGVIALAAVAEPKLRKVHPERVLAGNNWLGVAAQGRYLVTGLAQFPLLPALLVLALVMGLALFAWYREGR